MDRLKNILVGVDFSSNSEAALRQAVRIAALNRAHVSAMHVVRIPVYGIPDGVMPTFELPQADLLLSTARDRWDSWPAAHEVGQYVTFDAVMGTPRVELLERARRDEIDLLVIGAHGDFDATRLIGSTAAACVQRAKAKVLVVREEQDKPFGSIAVCVDFTETSKLALEQAVRIAALDGAFLHILHVYDDPWHGLGMPDTIKTHMPDFAERYHRAVEGHLRSFCGPMVHEIRALKAEFHAMQFGGHGRGIVDFVTRQGCDLVVLGTRARWNLRDFLLGSTAERVVREAPCSVLAIKPPGFEQPPHAES